MWLNDMRMAFGSIRSARLRSGLTMLGVVIGVLSILTIISIGEGVKKDMVSGINQMGSDLITVKPGRIITYQSNGKVGHVNVSRALLGSGVMSESDFNVISRTQGVKSATPINLFNSTASVDGHEYQNGFVVGTTDTLPQAFGQKVEFGSFFGHDELDKNVAIIGRRAAQDMFKDPAPMGRSFQIRGQTFVVRGVFDEFDTSPLVETSDYNYGIFVPLNVVKSLSGGPAQIQQILVRPSDSNTVAQTTAAVQKNLTTAHGGQSDFSVLSQRDSLAIADRVVSVLTLAISSVAAISLIVGGIGIMNIMLVSVSERTHEIGVRKAIGATNRQIRNQFVIEAAAVSFVGGIIGILLSLVATYLIHVLTPLHPVIAPPMIGISLVLAIVIGVFFGTAPAVKAARKDPIEALRQV